MANRRQDLERLAFKAPEYLAFKLAPPLAQTQKTGTIYYADIQSAGSVQTNRTLGTAPTATALSGASTTFDLNTLGYEKILRKLIDVASVDELGGLLRAEQVASRITKRACLAHIEAENVAKVLGNSSVTYSNILNDLLGQCQADNEVLADYAAGVGDYKVAYVSSAKVIQVIKKYAEVTAVMSYTGVIPKDGKIVRPIGNEILAEVLGVDMVLGGPLAEWYTASSTYQQRAALVAIPDANADPLEQIQWARNVTFPVSDQGEGDLFLCETYEDNNLSSYVQQTRVFSRLYEFNVELVRGQAGLDPLNASSTTTTTTTSTTTAG